MKRYPIWSYLNICAIDAPLISIAWYLYFAEYSFNTSLNVQNCLILGISVWLGYMADRLFDVRLKEGSRLISLRHQFCKENELKLWTLWVIILIAITIFSLNKLNNDKLFVGLNIMLFILIYNCLNQCFSRKRFPKEICVAVLFSYGTLFLIEKPLNLDDFLHFTIICFLNCIILTHKDRQVDDQMGFRSWSYPLSHQSISIIIVLLGMYFLIISQNIGNSFFIICAACLLLHRLSKYLNEEKFRVALESSYTIIPLSELFFC